MKKRFSETIDGSIKNIIQLKTLDASLEYSQMYDALEDCPDEFKSKLIGALNSLGETMGVSPCETFNKVLCKSDDGDDVKKKLYNWWRAVFEVLSNCKVPDDRMDEYNQKVDDLMAEVMKAGDAAATDEQEEEGAVVAEEYEPASLEDEAKMLDNMEFAIRHLGEVASKVQALVNFVNPYCGTTFNEENKTMKFKKINERIGGDSDDEWLSEKDIIGMKVTGEAEEEPINWEDDGNIKPQFKVGDKVCWTDPETDETTCGWTVIAAPEEGDESGDEIYTIEHPRGSEAEVYVDELEPDMMVKEANESLSAQEFVDAMIDADEDMGDVFEVYDGGVEEEDTVYLNVLVHKESVSQKEVQAEFKDVAAKWGWEFESFGYSSDMVDSIVDDDNCALVVYFKKVGEQQMNEEKVENELKKGDDGWTTIGQPVSEAKVVVDANDVWDVLELLDNDIAHNELTDLINSHVRTEDEIMDAINELSGETITKKELNTLLSGRMATLVDYLGLDVEQYENMGNFVDSDKPTSVELENTDDQKPEEVKSKDKTFNQDGENKTLVTGEENNKPVCEMTIEQEIDDPWKLSELLWSQGKENLEELLRSGLVEEEDIMMMLEDSELHNLTSINDAFAFDFPSILDSLGLDGEAWSQNLEFKRKGDSADDEEQVDESLFGVKSPKKVKDKEAKKIEAAIPVDDKDGLVKVEKEDSYGRGCYVAYFAPGSAPEISHAASELRKTLPEYQIFTTDSFILLRMRKSRK